ncbi:MAG: OB-fold protein [Flavisolibacter sp.]
MRKLILLVVLLAIGAGVYYAYREYHRVNRDLKGSRADFTTDALSLIDHFAKDSSGAGKKYTDKLVSVSGTVKSIDTNGNPVVIALGQTGQMSSVQCSMDSVYASEYSKIKEGDLLTIKGMCTGGRTEDLFGTDVILNRCVLENKKQ